MARAIWHGWRTAGRDERIALIGVLLSGVIALIMIGLYVTGIIGSPWPGLIMALGGFGASLIGFLTYGSRR